MNFYFCESCGKRITDEEIKGGKGRDKKLKGVYCADCALGVSTMEMMPVTDTDLNAGGVVYETDSEEPAPAKRSRPAVPSISRDSPVHPIGTARRSSQEGKAPAAASRFTPVTNAIVMGIGAGMVVLGFIVFARPHDSHRSQTAEAVRPVQTQTPPAARPETESTASEHQDALPLGAVTIRSSEPSPKERYDQKVREGKIKPVPPPSTPAQAVKTESIPAAKLAAGAPEAGYGKPDPCILWRDFENGSTNGWDNSPQIIEGGYAPASKKALKITSRSALWPSAFTPTQHTVIRLAVWVAAPVEGAQVMCWDETANDNAVVLIADKLKPGAWVLLKLPLRDFFYWEKKDGPVGHTLRSISLIANKSELIVDDLAVYEEP